MKMDYRPEVTPPNQILRSKYACDDEWVSTFLKQAQVGHIATHWDNQPFITPNLFWYDPDRRAIFFHTNIVGRLQANVARHPEACFEACNSGKLLPSNVAMEFGFQYESVVVFGKIHLVEDDAEKRRALDGLLRKYFPRMKSGKEYRPITDAEMKPTAVFAIEIESWSGKRNWKDKAKQSSQWALLDPEWLTGMD
jgi:nitroimidazol reductase NimA-like FMN-containing flavoprotein (pyridoxamine 5'-phosphate oxidase superfamily)